MPLAGWQAAGLLILSNLFMTVAWYGHLRFRSVALWIVILVSWGIAFFEYCLQVPANRIGSSVMTAPQLKGLQEVISILVFAAFSALWLGQPVTPRQCAGFALVAVAAYLLVAPE